MATTSGLPNAIRVVHQPDNASNRLVMVQGPLPVTSDPSDMLIKVVSTCPCLGELTWAVKFPAMIPPGREPVPGQDVGGIVITAPEDSGFQPGDEVIGRIDASRPGGCREYAVVRKEEMALKPKGLGWAEATATPLSALTAWEALFFKGTLQKEAIFGNGEARRANAEKRVFIAGAGGSVGGWAVQFAALAGAGAVIALCSGAKAERMKEFGATDIVDYKQTTAEAWVGEEPNREADLVVDCVGGKSMGQLWSVVKDGGAFVSISGDPDSVKPKDNKKTLQKGGFFVVESLGTRLGELAGLVEAGRVKPVVDSVFEFEQFAEAFDRVGERKANGKVVIKISKDY